MSKRSRRGRKKKMPVQVHNNNHQGGSQFPQWRGKPQSHPNMREILRTDRTIPTLLYDLLTAATPMGTEKHIINLLPFKDKGKVDKHGNFIIQVGKSETMFSSHMDTVHHIKEESLKKGEPGWITLVTMDDDGPLGEQGMIYGALRKFNKNQNLEFDDIQLGADDKVGVYTMCIMIQNGIPGTYVFHMGEEKGCVGSNALVKEHPAWLNGLKRCIAFDRKGYTDVIAFQGGQRRASKECSNALAKALNEQIQAKSWQYEYKGDVHGVWTDSAVYSEIIPECINLSVGYFDQHCHNEKFDYTWYITKFLPAVLALNWEALPTIRDPKEKPKIQTWNNGNYAHSRVVLKPEEVTDYSHRDSIPTWIPATGYILRASREGMGRIVERWLDNNGNNRHVFVEQLLFDKENLELDVYERDVRIAKLEKLLTDNNIDFKELPKIEGGHSCPLVVKKADEVAFEEKKEKPKQEVIPFRAPNDETDTGVPKDDKTFLNQVSKKMLILQEFGIQKDKLGIKPGQQWWQTGVALHRDLRKLDKKISKNHNCSVGDYENLNRNMMCWLALFHQVPEFQRDKDVKALLETATNHVNTYDGEPGFEASAELIREIHAFDVV